jgi:two-component system, response regulator PdtaR
MLVFKSPVEPLMSTKVLIVEDDALIALGMTDVLSFAGFEIIGPVSKVSEAVKLAESARPSVAVLDISLAGRRDGIEGANLLKEQGAQVVFVSALPGETLARARALNPAAILSKPCHPRELLSAVQKATGRHSS